MIGHVAVEVRREGVDAEVAFWGLLGYAPVAAPGTLGEHSTWVARGDFQIHLMHDDAPVAPSRGHVAILVGDAFDETSAALRRAGFEVEPREEHWGAARAFTRSPGGHRVELMAGLPPRAGR